MLTTSKKIERFSNPEQPELFSSILLKVVFCICAIFHFATVILNLSEPPVFFFSGVDCYPAFEGMQKCLQSYPELYKDDDDAVDINEEEDDSSPRKKS